MAELIRKNLYQCKACQCSFSRNIRLQLHMASHTSEENILYGDIFCQLPSIKEEVRRPKRRKTACLMCRKRYSHMGHYRKHLWNVHAVNEMPPRRTLSKAKCRQRGMDVGKDVPVEIPLSLASPVIKSAKKVHFKNPGPVKPTRRIKRGRLSKSTPLNKESGDKKYYECPECKKRVTHPSTLNAHRRIHSGERPYRCPVCFMTFTFYQCLWNHSWIHKSERHFVCDQCPKKYRHYQSLWTHYKRHTGKRSFLCDVCKLGFASSSQLIHHKKKHSEHLETVTKGNKIIKHLTYSDIDEMGFECEICSRRFKLKISLKSHEKKCFLKSKLSLRRSNNNKYLKESPKICLTKGRVEVDQKQKRGRGRPKKPVMSKEVERKLFINTKASKMSFKKQKHICTTCKRLLMYCVCCVEGRGENETLLGLPSSAKVIFEKLNAQSQIYHTEQKNKMASGLYAENNDLPKRRCPYNIFTESTLRKSKRLRGEGAIVLECTTCGQWLTSATEEKRHQKRHGKDKPYKCSNCSKCYMSMSWLLRHQHLKHREMQKEKSFVNEVQKITFRKKQSEKNLHKCLCCGTIFITYDDYKEHITCVSCVCGQQFQCGYIFCFHLSTCGENIAAVREEAVDQTLGDSGYSLNITGSTAVQQKVVYLDVDAMSVHGSIEFPKIYTDRISVVIDAGDSASSSSFGHYQSEEERCWQLISTASPKGRVVTVYQAEPDDTSEVVTVYQAEPDDTSEVAEDLEHVPETSEEPMFNIVVKPNQEAGDKVQTNRKSISSRQKCQCTICDQEFLFESELISHGLNHIPGDV